MNASHVVTEGRVGGVRYRLLSPAGIEFRFYPRNLLFLRLIPIFPSSMLFAFVWLIATGLKKGDSGAFWIGISFFLITLPIVIYGHRLAWLPRTVRVTSSTIFSSRPGLFRMIQEESRHSGELGALQLKDGAWRALILTSPSGEHIAWLITTKRSEQIEELLNMLKKIVRLDEGSISKEALRKGEFTIQPEKNS